MKRNVPSFLPPQIIIFYCLLDANCNWSIFREENSRNLNNVSVTWIWVCGEVKEGMIGCDSSVQHTCIVRESKPIRTGHRKRTREREDHAAEWCSGWSNQERFEFCNKKIDKDMHLCSKWEGFGLVKAREEWCGVYGRGGFIICFSFYLYGYVHLSR